MRGPRGRLVGTVGTVGTVCAGALLTLLTGCSGGSGQAAAPGTPASGSPSASGPFGAAPGAPGSPVPVGATRMAQFGPGDKKVTAVFQPSVSVPDDVFAELARLVQARAALIPGTVVIVTASGGSITVVGDSTQLDAIKELGRPLSVSFRPVVVPDASGSTALPSPSRPSTSAGPSAAKTSGAPKASGAPTPSGTGSPSASSAGDEAAAETAFTAANCFDPTTLPDPAAPNRYAVACSADGATKYLLGPAGAAGADVSQVEARSGASGWEVDVTFTAHGATGLASMTSAIARDGGALAVVWDSTVASSAKARAAIGGGAEEIGGLTADQAKDLAAILDLGARSVTLDASQVTVLDS